MYVREIKLSYGEAIRGSKKSFKLDSPSKAHEFLKEIIGNEICERFIVLMLNNKNILTSWKTISQGTVSEAILHPREVFIAAIRDNASCIILAHNHPSGILDPSSEDVITTRRIIASGAILGIGVLDHLILTPDGYLSMRESGHMTLEPELPEILNENT